MIIQAKTSRVAKSDAWLWLSMPWLKWMLIALVVLGVYFRFVNLDLKPYWFDETSTSVQISGYSHEEIIEALTQGQPIRVSDLAKYQYPSSEKTAFDTIANLAIKEPQLPPFYFLMARSWVQWFGQSITVIRSLSAVLSLLALPCVYWLCQELFSAPLVGWIAIALFAISPFHVLYAQEARPPSLWILMTLLSSIALLRLARLKTVQSGLIYAIVTALSLYTYPLSILTILSHGIYLILAEGLRVSRAIIAYLSAFLIGLISFAPWIFFALIRNQKSMSEQSAPTSFSALVKAWIRSIGLFFIDLSLNENSPRLYFLIFLLILLIKLIGIGYALVFLCRKAPQSAWLFVITSIAVPFGLLAVSDVIFQGSRSGVARYIIPSGLGIQIAVAYLFSTKIQPSISAKLKQPQLWRMALVSVFSIGVFSCAVMSQTELWWSKDHANLERQLARTINQADRPLVISDGFFVRVLSLGHSLNQNVQVQMLPESQLTKIPSGFSEVFLYNSSAQSLDRLKQTYQIEAIHSPLLWKVLSSQKSAVRRS